MGENTALQKYGTVDVVAMAAERERLKAEQAAKRARAGFLKTEEGQTLVRVAPPWRANLTSPILKAWMHKIKDPNDLEAPPKWTVPCNSKNHGKRCVVCTKCKELRATGSKVDKELAFQWGSQQRYYAAAQTVEKLSEGWLLWEFGVQIYDELLAILSNEELGGDVTNPETGRNLIVDRTGKGKNDTKYKVKAVMKPSRLPQALLDSLIALDQLIALVPDATAEEALNDPAGTDFPPAGDGTATAQDDVSAEGATEYTPPQE